MTGLPKPLHTSSAEVGFTLIELIVVVAIISMLAVFAIPYALIGGVGAVRSAEVDTQTMVNETRALAAANAGSGNTGATLQFTFDAASGDTIERAYLNRPMSRYPASLVEAPNLPDVDFHGVISLTTSQNTITPPFAIFIGSAGHISAAVGDYAPPSLSRPFPSEPNTCNVGVPFITITLTVGGRSKRDSITCFNPVMSDDGP
jgi:prepilin-type N-terminal cleavage/methylation domain-containing protein